MCSFKIAHFMSDRPLKVYNFSSPCQFGCRANETWSDIALPSLETRKVNFSSEANLITYSPIIHNLHAMNVLQILQKCHLMRGRPVRVAKQSPKIIIIVPYL